jgi:hypothetical protein
MINDSLNLFDTEGAAQMLAVYDLNIEKAKKKAAILANLCAEGEEMARKLRK